MERRLLKNILIVSGHTSLQDSVANKTILMELEKQFPQAEMDCLDSLYPDYHVDVESEQEKLLWADVVVLQFPIFWYGMPSLLSKWMEDTFQHGFSHGSTGDKLKGKKLVASFTTGAPEDMYHRNAAMGYEIEDFLPPLRATCHLCGMEFSGFIYTGGVSYQSRNDVKQLAKMKEKAKEHVQRLTQLLNTL